MALTEEEEDELDRLQLEKLRREDAAIRKEEAVRERAAARKREVLRRRAGLREARSLKRELRKQRRSAVTRGVINWVFDSESALAELLRMVVYFGLVAVSGTLIVLFWELVDAIF